ncbi:MULTISPECIES: NADPH-dependent FMN reductase [unclassified Acidocella]|uniref:NADPH-dependent FMN reductase n=1 Tax=unclassified Acidocella TaxID=2648610 RepID=UPI00028C4E91|nr:MULTISPECIES: NAD(P)H-dependent oxidoreductase [unclassified Acidocella]EKN00106.1 chromate reductase [Acidocella sp. MX-AZ02]WBO59686.1 NAD(P)H-dependent oxidoreductase [Acidocella sp. MX-AZ03]
MKILGISGSLRTGSWNTSALHAAAELLPEHHLGIAEIGDLPLMNQDLEKDGTFPPEVERLRQEIRGADAILFATPEYNASIPAPLKNAIDWGSRGGNVWAGKPAAIIGVSPGALGTARGQYPLRQTLGVLNLHLLGQPEVFIGGAGAKFQDGKLTDEPTRAFLAKMLEAFITFAAKVNQA